MIEKCNEFRRVMKDNPAQGEIQLCSGRKQQVFCGGFSDCCPFPKFFKSVRGLPESQITFSFNVPKVSEMERRIQRRWELGEDV